MSITKPPDAVTGARLGAPLLALAAAQLVIALDFSIVYVALPGIRSALGFSAQDLQWVVSAYVVATGGLLLLGGRATDLLGRRRMFVLAALLYAASSLVGGLSESAGTLVAVRAVQGLGGALLFPATLSLINTVYAEGPARNRALAVWGAAGAGGLCFGSLLGGALVQLFGWQAVFFVNVPLAGAIALAGHLLFPADTRRPARGGFDILGALTATAGITLLVFVLVRAPETGWRTRETALLALTALALTAIFVVVESRSRAPLVPPRLFARRGLVGAMALTALYGATFSSTPYFLTLYFQTLHRYTAFGTGLAFLVPAVIVAIGARLGAKAVSRFGLHRTLLGGMLAGAAGALTLGPALADSGSYPPLLPGLLLLSLGQGIGWTAMWIAAAAGVAPDDQGIASGLASTTLQVGGALGLAILVASANSITGSAGAGPLDGIRTAVHLIAAGLCCGALMVLAQRRTHIPPTGPAR
ncbi:MFS transporter [Streptomyces sp. NPDC058665]|uniref:MFS transporter n=1 Tax=Streptomyces sp. NPDC058665 TaxID=3346586 RepID=UPI003667EB25